MTYIPIILKYRPKNFKQIIGQELMVRGMQNSLKQNKIPNALLLVGIRGSGKTTTARIVASALNCMNRDKDENPCGKCKQCDMVAHSTHPDILELDAASHTSVDDIREILNNVPYATTHAEYKVYMIDEIHMLSKSAFNALLKTLEEPPSHVKFIFATTEVNKIPATIISRCQRFDLKRVPKNILVQHYNKVLEQEKCVSDKESLESIAEYADGSVRDGLSILEKAIAITSGNIDIETLNKIMGYLTPGKAKSLFESIYAKDIDQSMATLSDVLSDSVSPTYIIEGLMLHIHNQTKDIILKKANSSIDRIFLFRAWEILQKSLPEIKESNMQIQYVEMLLLKLIHINTEYSPEQIIEKLEKDKNQDITPKKLADLAYQKNELILYHHIMHNVVFVNFEFNKIQLKILSDTLSARYFQEKIEGLIKKSIEIELVETDVHDTLAKQMERIKQKEKNQLLKHPLILEILKNFTDLEVTDIRFKN